jgi:cyclophilin family peptidyl-prolyl cis-trans isomerase
VTRVPALAYVALVALAAATACKPTPPTASTDASAADAATASSASSAGPLSPDAPRIPGTSLDAAENLRRTKDVSPDAKSARDPLGRRRAARALARIADESAEPVLLDLLLDDDPEVVTWAAYGLGYTCKGHEDPHVKALTARAASLSARAPSESVQSARIGESATPRGVFTKEIAIARAIGRCATPLAEDVLLSWLGAKNVYSAPAALGLGDLAVKRKALRPETIAALAAAGSALAAGPAGSAGTNLEAVFHPLARVVPGPNESAAVLAAARAMLAKPSDYRILAIKALGKVGKDAVADLAGVAGASTGYSPAERAEAARALGAQGEPGHLAAADVLVKLVPDKDPVFVASLGGADFGVLTTLVDALGEEPPKRAEPVLAALSRLARPEGDKPDAALVRRIGEVRCAAALGLARGAHEAESLVGCAPAGSETQERARLRALLRRPLVGDRKAAFVAFARSAHLRVRELAIEGLARHAELAEAGRESLEEALSSEHGGLVATAADAAVAHPERLLVLSAKEKRAALDPKAPPPSANPEKELDPKVGKALEAALARAWPEDRFETRISLVDAAVALGIPSAKKYASAACTDPNVTVRERAQKALRTLGETRACDKPEPGKLAPELAPEALSRTLATSEVALTFVIDSREIVLRLEPELSPVTVARITSLARAGFYKGVVVHRVVPGFVLQFGDPDSDGYGGSGNSLRCETSPAPFGPRDVGMALAGRDTGSSQLFVTLSRTPHLDGEYTRLGRAEGDVDAVAEGDTIADVRVSGP